MIFQSSSKNWDVSFLLDGRFFIICLCFLLSFFISTTSTLSTLPFLLVFFFMHLRQVCFRAMYAITKQTIAIIIDIVIVNILRIRPYIYLLIFKFFKTCVISLSCVSVSGSYHFLTLFSLSISSIKLEISSTLSINSFE